ncbi:MAG: T9SS type A sorting domain-containing protein, partial [bacterium]|nr:T9SS type A sorting domain-containing protein [bacterium]
PNPFNPSTTISYTLPSRARVHLGVYDVRGRLVATLADDVVAPGPHAVDWDGRNDRGIAVPSGVYFYRLQAGTEGLTRKMVLLK